MVSLGGGGRGADVGERRRVFLRLAWSTELTIDLDGAEIALDLRHWLNSGLMTFFFVVGLEARREPDLGELRERRRFALRLLAGIGGMAVAVAIYLAFNAGRSSAHGWGIAMSTVPLAAELPRPFLGVSKREQSDEPAV